MPKLPRISRKKYRNCKMYQFHWRLETETWVNFTRKCMVSLCEMIGRIKRLLHSARFNVFEFFRFWSDNDIYFVSGCYGCSSVVAADAVADVAVAVGPVFVACYHCHLPRSSYKHGASLKAPYPLRIYHSFLFNLEWKRKTV